MKVYLASRFHTQAETRQKAEELRAMGIEVTSRWLEEVVADTNANVDAYKQEYLEKHAEIDIEDIIAADVLVLFTVDPDEATKRGGRHFESGVMFGMTVAESGLSDALRMPLEFHIGLITVGPRENIFHYMPSIPNFPTWEEAKAKLGEMQKQYEGLAQKEAVAVTDQAAE